jgi:hypothetical protein
MNGSSSSAPLLDVAADQDQRQRPPPRVVVQLAVRVAAVEPVQVEAQRELRPDRVRLGVAVPVVTDEVPLALERQEDVRDRVDHAALAAGSATPASRKPRARNWHESQAPHAPPDSLGS